MWGFFIMKLTIKHDWTYTRKVIENKFLEVKIDHKLNWKSHIHHAEALRFQFGEKLNFVFS